MKQIKYACIHALALLFLDVSKHFSTYQFLPTDGWQKCIHHNGPLSKWNFLDIHLIEINIAAIYIIKRHEAM